MSKHTLSNKDESFERKKYWNNEYNEKQLPHKNVENSMSGE